MLPFLEVECRGRCCWVKWGEMSEAKAGIVRVGGKEEGREVLGE